MNELALPERSDFRELALFAGAGGGILGGLLHGWRTVAAVEIEDYPRRVLLQRQADGILPRFPIWDDVCTFDGKPWRGKVDVVTGGFPCQDISAAGKGAGITGARSGLWAEMARIIGEVRPRYAFVENSPLLVGRGLAVVLGDLASLGYDARWGVLGAADVGAPHQRDRIWIVADAKGSQNVQREPRNMGDKASGRESCYATACLGCEDVAHANMSRLAQREGQPGDDGQEQPSIERGRVQWWDEDPADVADAEQNGRGEIQDRRNSRCVGETEGKARSQGSAQAEIVGSSGQAGSAGEWTPEPFMGRVAHGVADRVDRLRAIGNGQVSAVAAAAWTILMDRIKEHK